MYSYHLFLIFALYCAHLCMKCSLSIFNFLKEISSLSHSIVFLYLLTLITEEGFLISAGYSLELCIQMGFFPFLFCLSLLFSQLHNYLSFLHFFFLGMVLISASCTISQISIHSTSGTLSDLIPWSICLFHCKIVRDLI